MIMMIMLTQLRRMYIRLLMIDASMDRILMILISVTDEPMDKLTKSVGPSFFGRQKQRRQTTYAMHPATSADLPKNLNTFLLREGIPAFWRISIITAFMRGRTFYTESIQNSFLGVCMQLYKPPCWSVGGSVGWLVPPSQITIFEFEFIGAFC